VLALLLACSDPQPIAVEPPPEPTLAIPESALDGLDDASRRERARG
jgi:hypothetical protein